MQPRKLAHPPRANARLEAPRSASIASNLLGFALALACIAGAVTSLAHGQFPWPAEVLVAPEWLEAIFRTLVTAVLGAALILVLREPKLEPERLRKDQTRDP